MKRSYTKENCQSCSSQLLIVPYIPDGANLAYLEINRVFNNILQQNNSRGLFRGNPRELRQLETPEGKTIFVIGLGAAPASEVWREVIAKCVNIASQKGISSGTVYLDSISEKEISACVEGGALGMYRFTNYKSKPCSPGFAHLKIGTVQKDANHQAAAKMIKNAGIRADAVIACRDLVNEPANRLGVTEMVEYARALARKNELRCKVISGPMLEKKGFGLIHAVGKGAAVSPALVELEYTPKQANARRIALIGKGVVFDSGGLCLKPAANMLDMKTDMAGAATVLSVMGALSALNIEHSVTAYIPLAENSIGNNAVRPGDVVTSHNGKTVEIVNTDAEGRLLLADALSLAQNGKHDEIIDVATLTGACSVALGKKRGAIFTDNVELRSRWLHAAEESGEWIWPLPLAKELENELKGDVADLKNCGDRFGGSITAALFLRQFTDATRWVHFDIAGPARNSNGNFVCPKGGTGFLVLSILHYLKQQWA